MQPCCHFEDWKGKQLFVKKIVFSGVLITHRVCSNILYWVRKKNRRNRIVLKKYLQNNFKKSKWLKKIIKSCMSNRFVINIAVIYTIYITCSLYYLFYFSHYILLGGNKTSRPPCGKNDIYECTFWYIEKSLVSLSQWLRLTTLNVRHKMTRTPHSSFDHVSYVLYF